MFVKELWQYPVKSLGGERIEESAAGASLRKFLVATFKPLAVRESRDRQARQMALF